MITFGGRSSVLTPLDSAAGGGRNRILARADGHGQIRSQHTAVRREIERRIDRGVSEMNFVDAAGAVRCFW